MGVNENDTSMQISDKILEKEVNNFEDSPEVECEDNYIPSSSHDAGDLFNPSSSDVDNCYHDGPHNDQNEDEEDCRMDLQNNKVE